MRVGRLQAATLSNIWKSLEPNLENQCPDPDQKTYPELPDKLQKQYIPMTSDSPLYRLISIAASNSSAVLNQETAPQNNSRVLENHIAFLSNNPSRVQSLPSIPAVDLDNHLPLPRNVQSTGNLFQAMTHDDELTRPLIPRQRNISPMEFSVPRSVSGNDVARNDLPDQRPASIISSQQSSSNNIVTEQLPRRSSIVIPTVRREELPPLPNSQVISSTPRTTSRSSSFQGSIFLNNATNGANPLPASKNEKDKKHWTEDYAHMDIDWSMQAMDVLYSASFYDYIRDEKNCDLSAQRLCRIIKDYKPRQVANALLWMIQGWSVENTSKLLRIIFSDWLPDLAGCVFSLISRYWPKQPQASLCVAFLLMNEPASSAALFIRSLTQGWTRRESIDLLTYLDAVLKWSSSYLQEVMTVYTTSVFGETQIPIPKPGILEIQKRQQPIMNGSDSELQKASHKLMVANARLAMAEYQLALFSHWSICPKCQASDDCEVAKSLPIPDYQSNQPDLGLGDSKVSLFSDTGADSDEEIL